MQLGVCEKQVCLATEINHKINIFKEFIRFWSIQAQILHKVSQYIKKKSLS